MFLDEIYTLPLDKNGNVRLINPSQMTIFNVKKNIKSSGEFLNSHKDIVTKECFPLALSIVHDDRIIKLFYGSNLYKDKVFVHGYRFNENEDFYNMCENVLIDCYETHLSKPDAKKLIELNNKCYRKKCITFIEFKKGIGLESKLDRSHYIL